MPTSAELQQAQATLDAHKDELKAWKAAVDAAEASGQEPPPPPPTLVDALTVVAHSLGEVALGVGGTAADAVGVIGGTLEALHENANAFFSNLRGRLGI